ncbi:MAG: MltA domain-containing protein [Methyloceanibacter sp.]|nr:MltA domain-containing protein [Methyloceanibacter sp.]
MAGPSYAKQKRFADLDGWSEDDQAAALRALANSMPRHADAFASETDARTFFETAFDAFALDTETPGFVTGYYEPVLRGSRTRSPQYSIPIHGRPDDLITTIGETERAAHNEHVTGFRETADGPVPYYARAEIDDGALAGRGLEVLFTDDPIDLFFMHVQGSGLVHLDDGTSVRLTFAGKNGRPYTSIARALIDRGELDPDDIDMDSVKAWLRVDATRGRELMERNESYIFFAELPWAKDTIGPRGAEGVPLTPGRSLAVDPSFIPLGTPVFVTVPGLEDTNRRPFRRLMIAQDVGSAIRGPQRGDIFFGTGEAAGMQAGRTRHAAQFHVLMRKR